MRQVVARISCKEQECMPPNRLVAHGVGQGIGHAQRCNKVMDSPILCKPSAHSPFLYPSLYPRFWRDLLGCHDWVWNHVRNRISASILSISDRWAFLAQP